MARQVDSILPRFEWLTSQIAYAQSTASALKVWHFCLQVGLAGPINLHRQIWPISNAQIFSRQSPGHSDQQSKVVKENWEIRILGKLGEGLSFWKEFFSYLVVKDFQASQIERKNIENWISISQWTNLLEKELLKPYIDCQNRGELDHWLGWPYQRKEIYF